MSTSPVDAPLIVEASSETGVNPDIGYDALVTEDHKPVGILHLHDCLRAGVA